MAQKVIIIHRGGKRRLNRGSRLRLKQIRWKIGEIITLGFITFLAMAAGALVFFWEMHHTHHYSDPPNAPQIKETEPSDP